MTHVDVAIADSWPNSMDDSSARKEWGWQPKHDLKSMTTEMLKEIATKLQGEIKVTH